MIITLKTKRFLISKVLLLAFLTLILAIIMNSPGKAVASSNYTQSTETIQGTKYTVISVNDSGNDAGPAVNDAIAAAKAAPKPVILDFPTGTYHFKDSSAIRAQYYISNASTAGQTPDGWRKVGLLFKDINDVTIRGNGSTFMFHGVMTPIVFDHAVNVNMTDLKFDFKRPVMSEMTVAAVGNNYVDMNIHPDSLYKIVNNRLQWTGEVDGSGNPTDNWVAQGYANISAVQEYDPNIKTTWRTADPISGALSAQDLGNRTVRFTYNTNQNVTVGHTYQLRNDVRKEEGAFIYRSTNINWTRIDFYAAPGLGIVGQYSDTLTFEQLNFAPRAGSGRTNASMADFMQISGCKGQITVNNSRFFGAHDDPINVHGTHLKVVGIPASNQVQVQFMQPQSWGFDAFAVNDSIDFIKGSTLLASASATVTGVTRVDDTNILLTLNRTVPGQVDTHDFFVENVTWNPDVTITNTTFESIPSRGILMTTRGNVWIDHNTFNRMTMGGILIASDARLWYESGMVRNLTISNNTFNNNGQYTIKVEPEVPRSSPDLAVHSNIRIIGNTFIGEDVTKISAKSVNGLNFSDNIFQQGGLEFEADSSKNVTVAGNTFAQSAVEKSIKFMHMYANTDFVDPSQGFKLIRDGIVGSVPVPGDQESIDIPQSQMTATADSQRDNYEASKALDGNSATMWHTLWGPDGQTRYSLPQPITIDLGGTYQVHKLRYLPRQDYKAYKNGTITKYSISTSADGISYANVAWGSWADDPSEKSASFTAISARYVKFTALDGFGGHASAAELNVEAFPQNLSLHAVATESSMFQTAYSANNVKDGNAGSFWAPQSGTGTDEWVQLDFGTSKTFNKATIKEVLNRTAGYKVQYYDGSNWVDLVSGTTLNPAVTHSFPAVTAQKVRLYITATQLDSNGWGREPNIVEFEVYGP